MGRDLDMSNHNSILTMKGELYNILMYLYIICL